MDSNSPAYPILQTDEQTYQFTTVNGDVYKTYFLSYAPYFSAYPDIASDVFGFSIERETDNNKHKGIDKRIATTIVRIVATFLISKTNVVVYVCDPSDGKGEARMRKFTGWFEFFTHESNKIFQMTSHFDAGGMTLYTVLLFNKHNPNKNRFIEAFMEINQEAGK